MKKSIIAAGATSIFLAAMPVVGVFAADPTITDNLSVTVSDYCIFKSGSQNDTYTATSVAAGALWTSSSDPHPMTVTCTGNYKITPTMTALTASGSSSNITYSATTATAGSQTWSASYVVTGDATPSTDSGNFTSGTAVNGSKTVTTAGDIWTVTYKVGLSAAQPSGTYTGTATYVLQTRS